MNEERKPINITVVFDQEKITLQTFKGEYRNLMQLLYDKIYIEDFGDCKGMGRCGTCLIEILNNSDSFTSLDRNEVETIKKAKVEVEGIRLSCQIIVDELLDNTTIKIFQDY